MSISMEVISKFYTPELATTGSAGFDLRVRGHYTIHPGQQALIPTGVNVHIRTTTLCGLLVPRSSLFKKTGLILTNGTGIIDSDYQGEIMVSLLSTKRDEPAVLVNGQRFAQLVFTRVETDIDWQVCNAFSNTTDRAEGRHGSTG